MNSVRVPNNTVQTTQVKQIIALVEFRTRFRNAATRQRCPLNRSSLSTNATLCPKRD